jgi:hypothetical protein
MPAVSSGLPTNYRAQLSFKYDHPEFDGRNLVRGERCSESSTRGGKLGINPADDRNHQSEAVLAVAASDSHNLGHQNTSRVTRVLVIVNDRSSGAAPSLTNGWTANVNLSHEKVRFKLQEQALAVDSAPWNGLFDLASGTQRASRKLRAIR